MEYVYYYRTYYKDEHGKTVPQSKLEQYDLKELEQIRFLKSFKVFNIESCEGIEWTPPPEVNRQNDPIEEVEAILRTMKEPPKIVEVSSEEAYYAPRTDVINMPSIRQFESSAMYYRTLLHECAHWTGHETRLARPGITERIDRASENYAEEELIAELGSHYLCAVIGIDDESMRDVSVGYLDAWIRRLKEDPNMIFRVAPRAQQAAEYILGAPLDECLR
ncbi:MAG: zincin-like metallopeptidase domain-containing protein [Bacteroidota bacterium]